MDAINKLLGENGYVTNSSNHAGERQRKRASVSLGLNNKKLGVVGTDVEKPTSANVNQRRKKSFGKNTLSKLEISNGLKNEHPTIVDESSFKTNVTPGKSGGTFLLPFGASITIPENCLGKKDELICRVATPHTRWQTFPTHLSSNEQVNSEIYTLMSPSQQLKKMVTFCLPYLPVNAEFNEVTVKVKYTGHIEWVNVAFSIKEVDNRPYAELEVNKLGTFLVTTSPKTEIFQITPQGCLYQARLSRHITVRFPKKSVSHDIQCSLQIIPITAANVQLCKDQHLTETAHIIAVAEFVDLITEEQCKFGRPVTIKLPLPTIGEQDIEGAGDTPVSTQHNDIVVLLKTSTGWDLVSSPYKFTRTTVCFDLKEISRFCVMQCAPGKQKKMKDAITLLEGRNEREKGEVCLFLSIKNKSWLGLVEAFSQNVAETKINERIKDGFMLVCKIQQSRKSEAATFRFSSFRRHQPLTKSTAITDSDDSFEIYEGITWSINLEGDLKFCSHSDLKENAHLRYFARLKESFRTFYFEPIDMDPRPLEACLNLVPIALKDESLRNKLTFNFKIEIEESTMVEFLVPDSPIEIVPEKTPEREKEPCLERESTSTTLKDEPIPQTPSTPKLRESQSSTMRRLTQITKPVTVCK